jgi:hypothetical protein
MTVLESAVLGILAVLVTGYLGYYSIRTPIMRSICLAATIGAFWMLLIIASKELIAWVVADLFS